MAFSGWPEEALDFYDGLAADNTKTYWTAHKAVYTEKVLRPMTDLAEELAAEFGEPKIFRPYRDVRFSPDKTPYKTHIGTVVGGTGYVQLSAEGLARRSPATARASSSRRSSPSSRRRTSPSTGTVRSSPPRAATRPTIPASRCSATRA